MGNKTTVKDTGVGVLLATFIVGLLEYFGVDLGPVMTTAGSGLIIAGFNYLKKA